MLKVGDIVRAPWRIYGDDVNLTGVVITATSKKVVVRWNGDGNVTPAGDESVFNMKDVNAGTYSLPDKAE